MHMHRRMLIIDEFQSARSTKHDNDGCTPGRQPHAWSPLLPPHCQAYAFQHYGQKWAKILEIICEWCARVAKLIDDQPCFYRLYTLVKVFSHMDHLRLFLCRFHDETNLSHASHQSCPQLSNSKPMPIRSPLPKSFWDWAATTWYV